MLKAKSMKKSIILQCSPKIFQPKGGEIFISIALSVSCTIGENLKEGGNSVVLLFNPLVPQLYFIGSKFDNLSAFKNNLTNQFVMSKNNPKIRSEPTVFTETLS